MKKIFVTLFVVFSFSFCRAQWVTIPDTNFVKYLKVSFPACMNGNQMDTTCSAIVNDTLIICTFDSIADLTGIQYFDNLKKLDCSFNQLTTLPKLPPSLTILFCSGNSLNSIPSLPSFI